MSLRILLKVSPRQSPSSAILLSISSDADWPSVEPDFAFAVAGFWADAFVDFSAKHQLKVVGHCLVWAKDDRTPAWFFRDGDKPASRELLLQRMRQHIETEVGRYRGRVAMWDVVNEALDDGTNYLRPSGWEKACGEDFIASAFEIAHQADPKAVLVYNDYNNELPAKREKLIRLILSLRAKKVPIHAIGLQGHYEIDHVPFADIEATLVAMRNIGVKVVVSELDLDVIPRSRWWADGGKYRPVEVKVGREAKGQSQILEGLSIGQRVVASGQFLLDSEGSLAGLGVRPLKKPATAAAMPPLYESRGRIEAISRDQVTLSHEPVPAISWPAMTMTFTLMPRSLATGLKVGDEVQFGFEQLPAGPVIRTMEKTGGAK